MNGFLVRIAPSSADLSDASKIITLTTPPTLSANATNTFTASNATLAKSTTYHVLVSGTDVTTEAAYSLTRTNSTSEDTGNADGWSIGDTLYWRTSSTSDWRTSTQAFLQIRINGTITGSATTSTNNAPMVATEIPD